MVLEQKEYPILSFSKVKEFAFAKQDFSNEMRAEAFFQRNRGSASVTLHILLAETAIRGMPRRRFRKGGMDVRVTMRDCGNEGCQRLQEASKFGFGKCILTCGMRSRCGCRLRRSASSILDAIARGLSQ